MKKCVICKKKFKAKPNQKACSHKCMFERRKQNIKNFMLKNPNYKKEYEQRPCRKKYLAKKYQEEKRQRKIARALCPFCKKRKVYKRNYLTCGQPACQKKQFKEYSKKDNVKKRNKISAEKSRLKGRKKRKASMFKNMVKCPACKRIVYESFLERDHIKPLSKRGKDNKKNIWLICVTCNRLKSNNSKAWLLKTLNQIKKTR